MIPNRVDDPMFTNMRLPGQRSSQSCYSGDPKSAAPTVVTDPDAIGCSCEGLGLQLRRVMLRCDVETRCFYASWLEGLLCALSEKPCKTSCLWKKVILGKSSVHTADSSAYITCFSSYRLSGLFFCE